MLFGTKCKLSLVSGLDIRHGGIHIKQYYKVTYLASSSDTGESMVLKVIDKINSRLKFLFRENKSIKIDYF